MKRGLLAIGIVLAALVAIPVVYAPPSGAYLQASQTTVTSFSVVVPSPVPTTSNEVQDSTADTSNVLDEVVEPELTSPQNSSEENESIEPVPTSPDTTSATSNLEDVTKPEETGAVISEPDPVPTPDILETPSGLPDPISTDLPDQAPTE